MQLLEIQKKANIHSAGKQQTMREMLEEADANLMVVIKDMRDAAKAAKWFEGAAQRNVPDAQADLAYMLWTGQGVAQDKPRAIKWWKAAAKAGNKRAQEQLERQLSTVEYFNEVTLPAWMEKVGMRSI